MFYRQVIVAVGIGLAVTIVASDAQEVARPVKEDRTDGLFAREEIPRLRIQVNEKALEKLKAEPRSYVKATIHEDGRKPIEEVGIKLKGAAGSFQEWDERPALTLNVKKFRKGATFHGLEKFHLNNSVQDETYLNEWICSELFRRAGVPAPRVSHARVWLNGRDVGLYVLKEGFDRRFLDRWFIDPTGNLYDGGFVQDLGEELEKDEGDGPDDRSDLRAIVEALEEPDRAERRRRVESLVDLDEFCTFMAMERMTCHWDGYSNSANNYRIYFDPKRGKAVFLPHGMDQMFGEIELSLFEQPSSLIGGFVIKNDAWRGRYRERVRSLLPLFDPADPLIRRVDEIDGKLQAAISEFSPEQATARAEQVAGLKERLIARAANLRDQIAAPDEPLTPFDNQSIALIDGWWSESENEHAMLEETEDRRAGKILKIQATGNESCVASWRRRVLLGAGSYMLQADVRTDGVVKPDDTEDGGVGVGVSGHPREQRLTGTTDFQPVRYTFEVHDDRDQIDLVLELRARSGSAMFRLDSLRLVRNAP